MPYQQGPLLLQSADNVGIVTTDYKLTEYASDELSSIDVTLGGWDPAIADIGVLMGQPSNPFPDVDVDAALFVAAANADPATAMGLDAIVQALGDANISLAGAISYAPVEAWVDSSTPFVSPAPAETLGIPVIPPNLISFSVSGAVVGTDNPPVPNSAGAPISASLLNTSQYGSPNFRVGDNFQVTATGPGLAVVSASATFNGVPLGTTVFGTIGFDGTFTLNGTMGKDQVGAWTEEWMVGNSVAADFSFLVVS